MLCVSPDCRRSPTELAGHDDGMAQRPRLSAAHMRPANSAQAGAVCARADSAARPSTCAPSSAVLPGWQLGPARAPTQQRTRTWSFSSHKKWHMLPRPVDEHRHAYALGCAPVHCNSWYMVLTNPLLDTRHITCSADRASQSPLLQGQPQSSAPNQVRSTLLRQSPLQPPPPQQLSTPHCSSRPHPETSLS